MADLQVLDKQPDRREPSEGSGAERGTLRKACRAGMVDLLRVNNLVTTARESAAHPGPKGESVTPSLGALAADGVLSRDP